MLVTALCFFLYFFSFNSQSDVVLPIFHISNRLGGVEKNWSSQLISRTSTNKNFLCLTVVFTLLNHFVYSIPVVFLNA